MTRINIMNVNMDTVKDKAVALGISNEAAEELEILEQCEMHLDKLGDERKVLYAILQLLSNRLERSYLSGIRNQERIDENENHG